ncbi:MAG: hypothetical protein L6R39_007644 [Caloplaca ligustica]|nr:MAG: hypothetical protein L6R39_007644 [Caloplaca ligustica]
MIYQAYFINLNRWLYSLTDGLTLRPFRSKSLHAAILEVSKLVYREAATVYYREVCFATTTDKIEGYFVFHPEKDAPLSPVPDHWLLEPGFEHRANSADTKARLVEDVSKIFTKSRKDLPKWLFGAAYVRNPFTYRSVMKPKIPGYSFPRFLRQIGSRNAAAIRSLRINTPGGEMYRLRRACWELPLFSTIIKKHMPNVRDIILGMLDFSLLTCFERILRSILLHACILTSRTTKKAQAFIVKGVKLKNKAIELGRFPQFSASETIELQPILLEELRGLIVEAPKLRFLSLEARDFPRRYIGTCETAIRRAFKKKLAAEATLRRRAMRNASKW